MSSINENEKGVKLMQLAHRVQEIETSKRYVSVRKRLTNPHPLIKNAKKNLSSKRPWTGLISTSAGQFEILSAPKNVGRVLRFANTVLKNLEKRGHSIIIEHGDSYAEIYQQKIRIRFLEKRKRVKSDEKSEEYTYYTNRHSEISIRSTLENQRDY